MFPYERVWSAYGKLFSEKKEYPLSWDMLRDLLVESSHDPSTMWSFFLAYEMGFLVDPALESLYTPSSEIEAYFQRSACRIEFNHTLQQAEVYIDEQSYPFITEKQRLWIESLLKNGLSGVRSTPSIIGPPIAVHYETTQEEYMRNVRAIQNWIRQGEVYQCTLSHNIIIQHTVDPFALFAQLVSANPTPFSSYLKLPHQVIVSCSPERLVQKNGSFVETRPIKGTRPRGVTADEDMKMLQQLVTSKKEISELVMITDLMRNDLSKVCEAGSVVVPELLRTEVYNDLYHRVSVVRGKVEEKYHCLDILRALFPGGSITGCPKMRSMELISLLEKRRRGAYTGSMGYFSQDGDMDSNILIRTLQIKDTTFSLQVGSGIVIDSDPLEEWQETLQKAAHIIRIMGA